MGVSKGALSRSLELHLDAGDLLGKHVRLLPQGDGGAAPDKPGRDPSIADAPRWPKFIVGLGAAAIVGGAVFGLLSGRAQDRQAEFEQRRGFPDEARAEHRQAEDHAQMANVLYASGGGAILLGLSLATLTSGAGAAGPGLSWTFP